jgi:hypothetical protein
MNLAERAILSISRECSGVTVTILPEDRIAVSVVVVTKTGNSLRVIKKGTFSSIEEAKDFIPGNSVLVLSVDGYGIINKQTDKETSDAGISKILPNAKPADLYLQKIEQGNTGKTFVSIVRKEKLNQIISELNACGFIPFDITLGPFSILNIVQFLADEKKIAVPNYVFTISDDKSLTFSREQVNDMADIIFGSDRIPGEYLVALAGCLCYFTQGVSFINNFTFISGQKKEFLARKGYKVLGPAILMFFFLLLVINMLLFSRYNVENNRLNATISHNRELVREADSLKELIKEKRALADIYNENESRLLSYYADRIASVIPSYVTLTRINLNPYARVSGNQNKNPFSKGVISVNGRLTGTGDLDMMIKRINAFKWVDKVEISNYTDSENEFPVFEIKIKTR